MSESNSQRKKRLAREFNEAKELAIVEREILITETAAFEKTPEGQKEMRVSRRKAREVMMLGAAVMLAGSRY